MWKRDKNLCLLPLLFSFSHNVFKCFLHFGIISSRNCIVKAQLFITQPCSVNLMEFTDNKNKSGPMKKLIMAWLENIAGKGENAGY